MYDQLLLTGLGILGSLAFCGLIFMLSHRHFVGRFRSDVAVLLQHSSAIPPGVLLESDLTEVPEVVRKYIRLSGAINKPRVTNFSVLLEGTLRRDEQSPWMPFTSTQYNSLSELTRLFFMKATMKHLPVAGYHRYQGGYASMDVRLLSLIPVQHGDGPLMNIAETVTMFNDMCVMAPPTLIDKRISWLSSGEQSATATFSNGSIVVSADLYFNKSGELIEFISHDRYALQPDGSMQRYPWITPLGQYQDFHGIRAASYAETILKYPTGDFCYGKFKVKDIRYNVTA